LWDIIATRKGPCLLQLKLRFTSSQRAKHENSHPTTLLYTLSSKTDAVKPNRRLHQRDIRLLTVFLLPTATTIWLLHPGPLGRQGLPLLAQPGPALHPPTAPLPPSIFFPATWPAAVLGACAVGKGEKDEAGWDIQSSGGREFHPPGRPVATTRLQRCIGRLACVYKTQLSGGVALCSVFIGTYSGGGRVGGRARRARGRQLGRPCPRERSRKGGRMLANGGRRMNGGCRGCVVCAPRCVDCVLCPLTLPPSLAPSLPRSLPPSLPPHSCSYS